LTSYSLYTDNLADWFNTNVDDKWMDLRARFTILLHEESELEEIVKLVGMDALSASDRLKLEVARSIREDYLHQIAFHEIDTYTSSHKQFKMMTMILAFYDEAQRALDAGVKIDTIVKMPIRERIGRFKYTKEEDVNNVFDTLLGDLQLDIQTLIQDKEEE
jgi:ATP synthase alpha/beta chain, C terminal domain